MVIGIWYVAEGNADFGVLGDFTTSGSPALAILAGVALSFFAMTGFENTANVAEETIDPQKSFPRSLIGGMIAAGVIYVLVSMSAALTVDIDTLAGSDAALLEVVKSGVLPISADFMTNLFAVIAMIAITNTTLVAVVTQPRILYGMANEDVVPGVFAKIHAGRRSPWVGLLFSGAVVCALLVVGTLLTEAGSGLDLVARLATVTVLFLLFIYALVIVSALKLRGQDEDERTYRANTAAAVRRPGRQPRHPRLVDLRRPVLAGVVRGPGRRGRRAVPARVLLRPAGPARGCGAGRPEPVEVGSPFVRRFAPGWWFWVAVRADRRAPAGRRAPSAYQPLRSFLAPAGARPNRRPSAGPASRRPRGESRPPSVAGRGPRDVA